MYREDPQYGEPDRTAEDERGRTLYGYEDCETR